MSRIHADPASHGQRFGQVTVTVDLDLGDVMIHAPRPGPVHAVMRQTRLNSLDEVRGAYQVQHGLSARDPIAADMARALKFAGQRLRTHQEGRKR